MPETALRAIVLAIVLTLAALIGASSGVYIAFQGTPAQVAGVLCTALGLSAIAMLGLALNPL
jgi:hypothetical protein